MDPPLQIVAGGAQVAQALSLNHVLAGGHLPLQRRQFLGVHRLQFILAGLDVQFQGVEVIEIGVVQPIQGGDIGQQLGLVPLQGVADLIDLIAHQFVLLDDLRQWLGLAEQLSEKTGLLVRVQFVEVEAA